MKTIIWDMENDSRAVCIVTKHGNVQVTLHKDKSIIELQNVYGSDDDNLIFMGDLGIDLDKVVILASRRPAYHNTSFVKINDTAIVIVVFENEDTDLPADVVVNVNDKVVYNGRIDGK